MTVRLKHASNAPLGGTEFEEYIVHVGKFGKRGDAAHQGLYEISAIQRYALGTRVVDSDGRVFRYALAAATVAPGFGASNNNTFNGITGGVVNAQAIGDKVCSLLLDATTGGATWFGTKNRMAGGYISLPTGSPPQFRRIVSHPAGVSTDTIVVTLDGPFSRALTAAEMAEVIQNPYSALYTGGNYDSVVGVPLVSITTGYYGWIQTWGPTWITPDVAGVGSEAHGRQLIFVGNGAIELVNDMDPSTYACQHAGFILGTSAAGDWTNPPFVMLQISP